MKPGDAYLLTGTVTQTGLARNAGGNTYTGDGSVLTIVAIDELNVRLDVDYDGNGFADTTIDTTWAALQ